MARNARGSRGTRETTNSAWFRFASECAQEHATERKGGERRREASVPEITCTPPLFEPLTYRDSRSADISWLISRRERERERGGEEEEEADAAARKVSPSPGQSSPYRHPETEIAPVPVLSLPVWLRSVTRLILETLKLSTFYVKRWLRGKFR